MKPYEKKTLLRTLRTAKSWMHHAAMSLTYYADGDKQLLEHSKEMQGAVEILQTWIEGIIQYDQSRQPRQEP